MAHTPPEGFSRGDEVTFDQLPPRFHEHYADPGFLTETEDYWHILWLKDTRAVLQFFRTPPIKCWVDC